MAVRSPQRQPQVESAPAPTQEREEGAVEVKIFYGIKEFGVIFLA